MLHELSVGTIPVPALSFGLILHTVSHSPRSFYVVSISNRITWTLLQLDGLVLQKSVPRRTHVRIKDFKIKKKKKSVPRRQVLMQKLVKLLLGLAC